MAAKNDKTYKVNSRHTSEDKAVEHGAGTVAFNVLDSENAYALSNENRSEYIVENNRIVKSDDTQNYQLADLSLSGSDDGLKNIGDLLDGAFDHLHELHTSFGIDGNAIGNERAINSQGNTQINDHGFPFADNGFGFSAIDSYDSSFKKPVSSTIDAANGIAALADTMEHLDDNDSSHHIEDNEHDDDDHEDDDDDVTEVSPNSGNDYIRGTNDDDVLDGGAGNDIVDGDRGDDTLIYDLEENFGATDFYDGGKGSDKLLLKMSQEQFDALQDEITQLQTWITDNANEKSSEGHGFKDSSSHSSKHQVFETSFGLNLRNIEELEIEITSAAPVNIDLSDPTQRPTATPSAITATMPGNSAISIDSADATLTAGSSVTFSIDVNVQNIMPMYDVFMVHDLSLSMHGELDAARANFASIYNTLSQTGDVTFGIGSFVDKPIFPYGNSHYSITVNGVLVSPNQADFVYNTDLGMSSDINTVQSSLNNLSYYYGGDVRFDYKDAQMEALVQTALRASSEIGFRDGAQKFVVLSTDSAYHQAGDFNATANNYDTIFDIEDYPDPAIVGQMLLDAGIIPIFSVSADQLATYQALVNSWGFGSVTTWTADGTNVVSAIESYVANNTINLTPSISGDDFGYVSSITPTSYTDVSAGTYTFDVTLDIPTTSTSYGSDILTVEIPGYGLVDINVTVPRVDATGDTGNDTLLGDNGANGLFGLAGMDIINGAGGNDHIVGGIGNDMLSGGSGDDLFVFIAGDGNDTITDFTAGGVEDTIDLSGLNVFAGFADVMASAQQIGADVVLDFGAGDGITLSGIMLADLTVDDFLI